jgi:valyl-tRNA synthetase
MREFSKKYDYKEVEPRIGKLWEELSIHKFDPNSDKPCFSVDTPPPYVSSTHLHVGHSMSYSQAEFVVRFKRMNGFNIFYPMGFDDNGLPTERFVEKKYKLNKRTANRKEFIDLCLKETGIGIKAYQDLWKALGISVDWDLTYSTIDERCRKTSQFSFLDLVKKGVVTRKYEPVMWCYHCCTSLAQADIDTQETEAILYDICFYTEENEKLIISTTRPELLPACVALYVHPDDTRYSHLIGKKATVPLFNHLVEIKTHRDVEKKFGTGIMMVCTWGDSEDIIKWREHTLDTRIIFDQYGNLNENAKQFAGLAPESARKAIVNKLEQERLVPAKKQLTHMVGVHDRCQTPVEFFQTKQWFVEILNNKENFLKAGDELKWYPRFMKTRYTDWIKGLKWDWCISRQRFYGVPFPVWYCSKCEKPWYPSLDKLPVDPTIDFPDENTICECGSSDFTGEKDVMDTWMTSSCTPLINALWAYNDSDLIDYIYPNTIRVQAFEIIRTWTFYTVVKSYYHTNSLPWKEIMISGWGLDEHGKKMSKSMGNFVEPNHIIEKYSADALRYWSASASLGQNLKYSEADVAAGRRILTKLWNASKFIASHTSKNVNTSKLRPWINRLADRWIYSRYLNTVKEATDSLQSYQYSRALQSTVIFFMDDFCDNYLEIVKVRLWEDKLNDEVVKENTVKNLLFLLWGTLRLFAPFIPFITEEIFQILFKSDQTASSIHIEKWPQFDENEIDSNAERTGNLLIELISEIRKLKTKKSVHSNFPLRSVIIAVKEKLAIFDKMTFDLKNAVHSDSIEFTIVDSSENLPIHLQKGHIQVGIDIELGNK